MSSTPSDFAARLASFASPYKALRESQAIALQQYADTIEASDLAIELPTGYGKTLVALLIADHALERGLSVAYLTGTNQLADQVVEQAAALRGLDVVRFSAQNYPPALLASYHAAKAVGVMNYWTYFNTSPRVESADLVIFDDAHLAEQPLAGLFAIRVDKSQLGSLYEQLCDLVLAQTDLYPSIELMREGSAGPATPPELLAFKHWNAIAERAAQMLNLGLPPEVKRFVWPLVRPNLPACGVLFGPTGVEVRPYHPPTQTLPGYRNARQRLYLSATLGTMDDLQRRLGVGPVTSLMNSNVAAGEFGERIFILNPGDDGSLAPVPVEFALKNATTAGRTAWLCASHSEADDVETLLRDRGLKSYRLRSGGEDDVLDRWKADSQGHLVTAGRYDGLDFVDDVCRLVILPSVPAASTEFERFVMAYLGDATYMRHRVGQRVTQALGRANRREGDWAMYLGLAPSFGTLLAQSAVQIAIPNDVRPVVDTALARVANGWKGAEQNAQEFWRTHRSPVFPSVTSARVRPGRIRPAATAGSAEDEVSAVTRLWLGDHDGAAMAAGRAASTLSVAGESEHAAFWRYVQAQAHFLEGTTSGTGRSIEALRAATEGGSKTAWFVRLGRVLAELRGEQAAYADDAPWLAWDEWIREAGVPGIRDAVSRCRSGATGTHDQQAEALRALGRILGVAADRPKGQGVTDTVWSWTSGRRVEKRLWEIKTGAADAVPRDWIDQALGQLESERAGPRRRTIACIVTSLESIEPSARTAADKICLVHVDGVCALIDLMSDRLLEYAAHWGPDAMARGAAREIVERRLPSGPWLEQLLAPTAGKFVRDRQVRKVFRAP